MQTPWILLTNDDGIDSPFLLPLIRELESIARVRAVVPATECSWTSKIMSRFDELKVEAVEIDGLSISTVSGYPADCANAGIFTLFDSPPSLVVSGINMGDNAGLAYFLSSGTVGAAIEGCLSGVPAIAFSQQLTSEDYVYWRSERKLTECIDGVISESIEVVKHIVQQVLLGGLPDGSDLMTVNMPARITTKTPRRFSPITRTSYGSFFSDISDIGSISYGNPDLEIKDSEGDIQTLQRGEISLTPIKLSHYVSPTERDKRRFELPS